MDKKPPEPTKDEQHRPADADPAAAKAAVDSSIQQLRAVPGQPALRDRAKATRGWSTFDRAVMVVAVWILFALAVVYVALWLGVRPPLTGVRNRLGRAGLAQPFG